MRIRIDYSNPIGAIIISIIIVAAAVGIVYGALDWLAENVILPLMRVPRDKREGHFLNKIVLMITGLVAVAGIVTVILPVFGVDTGPLSLLNILE
jgi:hypothetical protein